MNYHNSKSCIEAACAAEYESTIINIAGIVQQNVVSAQGLQKYVSI